MAMEVPMLNRLRLAIFAAAAAAVMMAGLVVLTRPAHAQRYTSPPATTSATIAGHKITVEYYAPSAHGRKIMGGLVPYGQVWCTGANYATAIHSDVPMQMGSLKLPAGSYSIWTIPG